jgi:hypothetical protein
MSPAKFPTPIKKEKKGGKSPYKKGVLPHERRKHHRFFVELPLDYSRKGGRGDFGGIVQNASEEGVLVHLPEKLDIGELLKIEIYFAKGLELNAIQGIAKVVWSDLAAGESWREHRYGLEFQSIQKGTLQKLKNLLKEVEETHKPKGKR